MIFEVQKSWETRNTDDDVYKAFSVMKLGCNDKLFLLDAQIVDEYGDFYTERYMIGTVRSTLNFIAKQNFKDVRIALLSRRCDNYGEYAVSDLSQIIEAKAEGDQIAHISVCVDGKRYVESNLGNSEEHMTEFKTIYYKNL